MVAGEELELRRAAIAGSRDLSELLSFLTERARPLLAAPLDVPVQKALLSRTGGLCPVDGAPLAFDPSSPHAHRCTRCGAAATGERQDRHWARFEHLWLAERAAHLAALAALGHNEPAGVRAQQLLRAYGDRYLSYPNADNVLGPSRLFFSTYLESMWLCNFLAAAALLRDAGLCDDATQAAVATVADEAATLIGEFDEGFSNRQTWNNAALLAIAAWFEDEALAERTLDSASGLVAHVARGFGKDGMWFEGENYHLFALRAVLIGGAWAHRAGIDLWADPRARARLAAALRAPAATALPDLTYPARKDARFGISLAQPAYVELWEVGLAVLAESGGDPRAAELTSWLHALYGAPPARADLIDAYLHDAPLDEGPQTPSRTRLSWWALVTMAPELAPAPPWTPVSELLASQGLAVLRAPGRYVSLECGPSGGGHGHADRLHLSLCADGVSWLADPGTTSYVVPELGWYRSTLAHNAPRLDGVSQAAVAATCEAFEARGDWAWVRGQWGEIARTVVSGPAYVLDLVEFTSRDEHLVELPWHVLEAKVETPGHWEPAVLTDPFTSGAERFVPDNAPLVLGATAGGHRLHVLMTPTLELWRAEGPGRPGSLREVFYLVRARGRAAQLVAVVDSVLSGGIVAVRLRGAVIEVETSRGVERHAVGAAAWKVDGDGLSVRLGGRREPEAPFEPWVEVDPPRRVAGTAVRVGQPPALDGTLAGFDTGDPLTLDLEDQYRRSEEPFVPDEFRALAYVNWDEDALFVAVEVVKRDPHFRPPDAPPLELDNEPDDVHSDGLQLYLRDPDTGEARGILVVPEGAERGSLRIRPVGGAADPGASGAWERTPDGYRVTLAVPWNGARAHVGAQIGFDLLVNTTESGRVRRTAQLVWSGGGGWVWLRGDRQPSDRFGVLELVG
ncbi:MAG TPA: heparinase II/III family protein [Gemmatimonadales bacterium]|nr:heparinase II/III family protein [Gemmatimonadales bacterium]